MKQESVAGASVIKRDEKKTYDKNVEKHTEFAHKRESAMQSINPLRAKFFR